MEITVSERRFPSSRLSGARGARHRVSMGRSDSVELAAGCATAVEPNTERNLNAAVSLDPAPFGAGPGGPELPVQ